MKRTITVSTTVEMEIPDYNIGAALQRFHKEVNSEATIGDVFEQLAIGVSKNQATIRGIGVDRSVYKARIIGTDIDEYI